MVLGLAAVLFCALAGTVSAQNTYERLSVIEEFTSATCGPCVPASEALNSIVRPENGVVSVRFHMNWPAPNDPWNIDNPSENQSRRNYYSVTGIPNGRLNGKTTPVTNAAAMMAAIQADNAQMAPYGFEVSQTVNQTGGSATVKVKTNVDLKAHKLYIAVVSRYKSLPNLPQELANSNGETEFYDAMNKMLPNGSGSSLNISAGGEETFTFNYTSKDERTWPAGQQYIVAYIQSDADGSILNAGTNLDIISARAEVQGSLWQKIDKGAGDTKTIRLYNDRDKDLDVDLSIVNYEALTQAGWTLNTSSPFAKIPANGSTDITVTATAPTGASFGAIQLQVIPVVSGGISNAADVLFGYLTNGARIAVYYGFDAGAAASMISTLTTSYAADAVYMPFTVETNAAFPASDFDAAVFPIGFNGRFSIIAAIPAINAMEAAGKGVWMHAPVGPAVALNDNNQQFPGYPAAKAWFTKIGVTEYSTVNRNDGQFFTSFSVTGVDGTDIGNMWSATANQPTQQWPFAMAAQDQIRNPKSGAQSFVYADNNQNNVNGVTWTDGKSRVVFSTFGPEHISAAAPRNTLTQRVMDYLLASNNNGPTISIDNQLLNFGRVDVASNRDLNFTITNTGNEDLTIQSIELSGMDAVAFDITSGRIVGGNLTVPAQGTHMVTVRFAPGAQRTYAASVVLVANAATAPVQVRGEGQAAVSVETEVVSETGSITMKLNGQNPVIGQSSIALSATVPTTVSVVDVSGNVVAQLFDGVTEGAQNLEINAANLASGSYTIIATNGSERAALTIVVAK